MLAAFAEVWLCTVLIGLLVVDDAPRIESDKRALAPLQTYVGEWRGVGQPKRGSNQGAWTEQTAWAWAFNDGRAELVARFNRDKYFDRWQVRPAETAGEFVLLASQGGAGTETQAERFSGVIKSGVLTATADAPSDGKPSERPAKITIRLAAGGDRMVVLYEKRTEVGGFVRLAEVGATRQGSSFAKNASRRPECVVTGGLGTIPVTHDGKTYHVCCGGCKDLFNDDPAGVLADYRARKVAERAPQAK